MDKTYLKLVFSNKLKEVRNAKRLSQSDLADLVNCNQPEISAYENEINPKLPKLDTAVKIADVLGITLDSLCGFDDVHRKITPFQWLVFMDTLISNPPSVNGKPLIEIKSVGGSTSIVFSGTGMNEFFKQYLALRSVDLDGDIFSSAIKNLFEKYASQFTPGIKTIGVNTPTPPKGESS